jgi:hypothetical protein
MLAPICPHLCACLEEVQQRQREGKGVRPCVYGPHPFSASVSLTDGKFVFVQEQRTELEHLSIYGPTLPATFSNAQRLWSVLRPTCHAQGAATRLSSRDLHQRPASPP